MDPMNTTYRIDLRKMDTRETITRDNIGHDEMSDILTSAVALAGVNYGGSIMFVTGITDRYTVRYRVGGPNDIFGETPKRTLTVTRNTAPTPAPTPVVVITADGVTGGTLNGDDTITPDPDADRVCPMDCDHCDPDTAAVCETFGEHRETPGMTTDELCERFTVIGFMAPFVVADRKADGVRGSLEFTHMPRRYFGWTVNR